MEMEDVSKTSESDDVETSIIHLPDDCLSFIFRRLDNLTDRKSFGLTCHRWLNIQNISTRSLQLGSSINVLNPSSPSQTIPDVESHYLHRLLTRFQWLQHLCLSFCMMLNDSSLVSLRYPGERLIGLYLECCFEVSDDGIALVASLCPNLRVISLRRCKVSDIGLEALARASLPLRCVNLSSCSRVTDFGIKALSLACLDLESVKISSCKSVTGVGFNGCSSTLRYVVADFCHLEPKGITGIISGGGIEFLDISDGWYLRKDWLVPLGSGMASRLRILDLRMCMAVGDESIEAIAKGCPLLQAWNLAFCHEVTVLGWDAVGKWCCNLRELHVNFCRNLCDQGLLALQCGCKNLKFLFMDRNVMLTPTAIEIFRLHRADVTIRTNDAMTIGPYWNLSTYES